MHAALEAGDVQRFIELRAEYNRAIGFTWTDGRWTRQQVPNAKQQTHFIRTARRPPASPE